MNFYARIKIVLEIHGYGDTFCVTFDALVLLRVISSLIAHNVLLCV